MAFDVGLALTWILFLALFPMAFFWLRRTWRIFVKRDFSEVALKRGQPPPDAERWAPYEGAINAVAGVVVVFVIIGVVLGVMPYDTWTAIAGSTIWCKLFSSFALGRHAHVAALRRPR
jgi:small-conductance mechanosensitive channel